MLADKISEILSKTGQSIKSLAKLALLSRRATVTRADRGTRPLIVLGNGPSLAANIAEDMELLRSSDTLTVNFGGNTPEFRMIRPKYYLLMDPHFFTAPFSDPNVPRLYRNLNDTVNWDMTLFIPVGRDPKVTGITNPRIRIERFNPIGVEGFGWLERAAFDTARGLPRPRNVLIPSIMTGIWLGYKEIYLLGADHSWLKTLDVDDDNTVVSIQPHFYSDGEDEHRRVASLMKGIRLHELLWGFHLAFKGYHSIRNYASQRGVNIYNATHGSYIDAFPRRDIKEIDNR